MKRAVNVLLVTFSIGLFLAPLAVAQVGGVGFGIGQGISVKSGPNGPILSGFVEVDIEKTIEYWTESHNETMLPQMELLVERIKVVCGLSEEETKRIRLAAKGVVSRRGTTASRQLEEFASKSGLIESPADIERESGVSGDDELVFFSASPMGDGVVAIGADFKKAITEHPFWINTLEKTLTSAQFEKYRQYRIENCRQRLSLAIDSWLAGLNSEIIMSPEQLDSVTDFVRKELEGQVTIEFPASMWDANELVTKTFAENAESLGDLLSEQQTALRKTLLFRPPGPKVSWGAGPIR